jgi:flagellar hook-associated protein 1 FlgK
MTSLFDVGKSAIQAYRQSLAVTGQNIANMNTEGYMRREADLQEVTASQGGITSLANQAGLGVRVSDIRRSFDAFLLDRARSTTSGFERMDNYLEQIKQLENMLLPSDSDLGSQIGRFFNALGEVASSPGDLAPRVVAIEEGDALASRFNELSGQLSRQQSGTLSMLDDATVGLSLLAKELASVNSKILSSGQSGQSPNSLLDLRDRIINDIAKLTDVSVRYNDRGYADVTFGSSGVGPSLVSMSTPTSVGYVLREDTIQIILNPGLSNTPTSQLSSGMIAGLVDAFAMTNEITKEVNHLASLISTNVNKQHKLGIDLDGNAGTDMFSTSGLEVASNPSNSSSLVIELNVKDALLLPQKPMKAVFDAAANHWKLTGTDLKTPLTGLTKITGPGFDITVVGSPKDGDSFSIMPEANAASSLKFLLKRPQEIAAASSTFVSADNKNIGEANLIVKPGQVVETKIEKPIASVLSNSKSPIAATNFLRDGLVAIVPAGTDEVSISSFEKQASASFQLSSTEIASLTQLRFELDGSGNDGPFTFNISYSNAHPNALSGEKWTNLTEVAELLNNGVLRSSGGVSLSELGLHASGGEGSLTLVSANGKFEKTGSNVAQLVASVGTTSAKILDPVDASDIQILTREGRHIAGSALTAAQISNLLNVDNGFSAEATYRGDYLNASGTGYRDALLDLAVEDGHYEVLIGSDGSTAKALGGTGAVPSNVIEDKLVSVTLGNGQSSTTSIATGSWASSAAKKINTDFANLGVRAEAKLRLELSAFQTSGEIQFDLSSLNQEPIQITASVTPTNLSALALAINRERANTGITATVSTNGLRLILESQGGEDISFSKVNGEGVLFSSKVLNSDGSDATPALVVGSVGANGRINAARYSGVLTLSSSESFSLDAGVGVVTASKNGLNNGLVDIDSNVSGDSKLLKFEVDGEIDASSADIAGHEAVSASATYTFNLPTSNNAISFSANLSSASIKPLTKAAVNRELVSQLRAQGPVSSMSGLAAPATLPANGSSVAVTLAGDTYHLTMNAGEVSVSGGEAGRVTAYFDAAGYLQIFGGGTLGGESFALAADDVVGNNSNNAAQFGLSSSVSRMTGQEISLAAGLSTLNLDFDGTAVSVDIAADGTITQTPSIAGLTLSFQPTSVGKGRLVAEFNSIVNKLTISKPSNALGFKVADARTRIMENGIKVSSLSGDVVSVDASATSLAKQTIKITNLPYEDLIILVTGNGARSVAAAYSVPSPKLEQEPLTFQVTNAAGDQIEVIDSDTGHSIATRKLNQDNLANFSDYQFELRGDAVLNDKFFLAKNLSSAGDNRNINSILEMQQNDADGVGSGGFQKIFSTIVAGVGASVQSGDISLKAAEANRDAAAEAETEFSGVNLDTEAAALMEFQQAYQASARILSTARELFQALMDVV